MNQISTAITTTIASIMIGEIPLPPVPAAAAAAFHLCESRGSIRVRTRASSIVIHIACPPPANRSTTGGGNIIG